MNTIENAAGALPELPEPLDALDILRRHYVRWGASDDRALTAAIDQVRALMAERDAARKAGFELRESLRHANATTIELSDERDALRRKLEKLRKAGAAMANTMFNLSQRNTMPIRERALFKSMQLAWDIALRPIPPDAREGREPLTPEQCDAIITKWRQDHDGEGTLTQLLQAAHGIGPAGTSADGETQP